MPDTIRLSVLTRLREDAGLTQAHVAQRCGLTGSNGRRSVAAWESGASTPRSRHRLPFALYLLRDLQFVHNPDEFDALWSILIDEWLWDPLDAEERDDLWRKALQETDPWAEAQAIVDGMGPEEDPAQEPRGEMDAGESPLATAEDKTDASVVSTREDAASPPQSPIIRLAVASAALVAIVGIFGFAPQMDSRWSLDLFSRPTPIFMPTATTTAPETAEVAATIRPTEPAHSAVTTTPALVTLRNVGFEAGNLSEWEIVGEECVAELIDDRTLAQDGRYFLTLTGAAEDCTSIRRDMLNALDLGDTVTYALWVRAGDARPQAVEVVVWAGDYDEEDGETLHVKSSKVALVDNAGWQCVETTLTLDMQAYRFFRGELYLKNEVNQAIEIDSTLMQAGRTSLCPPATPKLVGGDFEHEDEFLAWRNTGEECNYIHIADSELAHQGDAYGLLESAGTDCPSLYQDWLHPPSPQTDYTAQFWVRSGDGLPRRGAVSLRAHGSEDVYHTTPFIVGDAWQCVSATLRVDDASSLNGLRTEIYFDERMENGSYALDAAQLVTGPGTCPSPLPTIADPSFEAQAIALTDGVTLPVSLWDTVNQCDWGIVLDPENAHSGAGVLSIRKDPPDDCFSVYTDLLTQIPAQTPIRVAFWGRASGERRLQGTFAIRALDGPGDPVLSTQPFQVESDQWRCIETVLTLPESGFTKLRTEIYIETPVADAYLFDDFQIGVGDTPLCEIMDIGLRTTELTHPALTYYPGGSISVDTVVRNYSNVAVESCGDIAIWVSEYENGPALDNTMVTRVPLPSLATGASSPRLTAEVSIPLRLDPKEEYNLGMTRVPQYHVVWQLEGGGCTDVEPRNNQASRFISIGTCPTDRLFCDVPTEHWARAEIETWHDLGISTGCRSNTTPFVDRPFCPGDQVRRITFTIFALRHLLGGGYQPDRGYEAMFADVPEDVAHRWALWAEDFYDRGYSLNDDACPPAEDKPRFCPDDPLSRADLVLSLAGMLGWELSPVEGTLYRDVIEDTPANRAVEYAARNGLLGDGDPYCPNDGIGARFCPDDPARRAFASLVMVRAFGE